MSNIHEIHTMHLMGPFCQTKPRSDLILQMCIRDLLMADHFLVPVTL